MSTPGSYGRHPAGERSADPPGAAEPVQRQARGDPEAVDPAGMGPSSGFASGVIASGWLTSRMASASAKNGNRRMAPAIRGSKRTQSGGSERDS